MYKQKYTQSQKNQYFAQLRAEWRKSKELAENDEAAKALHREVERTTNSKYSYWSFYFTLQDMRALGLDGLPYIDCKTFLGWKQSGFKVKKGEKSKIRGIVWMSFEKDENGEEDDMFMYPKIYHLFHKSQVELAGEVN